jgi:ribosome-binding factor A
VDLRVMPKLRFFWDPTPERAQRLDQLLMQIKADEGQKPADNTQNPLPKSD